MKTIDQDKRRLVRQQIPVDVLVSINDFPQISCGAKDLTETGLCLDAGPSLAIGTQLELLISPANSQQNKTIIKVGGVVTHSSTEGTGIQFSNRIDLLLLKR